MKRIILYIAFVIAVIVAATSCRKSIELAQVQSTGRGSTSSDGTPLFSVAKDNVKIGAPIY